MKRKYLSTSWSAIKDSINIYIQQTRLYNKKKVICEELQKYLYCNDVTLTSPEWPTRFSCRGFCAQVHSSPSSWSCLPGGSDDASAVANRANRTMTTRVWQWRQRCVRTLSCARVVFDRVTPHVVAWRHDAATLHQHCLRRGDAGRCLQRIARVQLRLVRQDATTSHCCC